MRKFFIFKNLYVLYHHIKPCPWCLVQGLEIFSINKSSRLAMKKLHKIIKKNLDLCLYLHFTSLFFVSIIAKMIIKLENTITIT